MPDWSVDRGNNVTQTVTADEYRKNSDGSLELFSGSAPEVQVALVERNNWRSCIDASKITGGGGTGHMCPECMTGTITYSTPGVDGGTFSCDNSSCPSNQTPGA